MNEQDLISLLLSGNNNDNGIDLQNLSNNNMQNNFLPTNNNRLDQLAKLFMMSGLGQPQLRQPKTVNVAGHNILDVTPRDIYSEDIMPGLQGLAQTYLGSRQLQQQKEMQDKENKFLNEIGSIAKSGKSKEEIYQDLLNKAAENPSVAKKYGMMDILNQYSKMGGAKPSLEQETTRKYELARATASGRGVGAKKTVKEMAIESLQKGVPLENLTIEETKKIAGAQIPVSPETATMASSIDSMINIVDDFENSLKDNPDAFVKGLNPFAEREFKAIVDSFDKQAAIAAGGKALTQTELNLIKKTRPTLLDTRNPKAIAYKFKTIRNALLGAKNRLSGINVSQNTNELKNLKNKYRL